VIAVQTVMQRAASDNPRCCLLCHAVTMTPGLIGFARRASKTGGGAVLVVCRSCSTSAADLHDDAVSLRDEWSDPFGRRLWFGGFD
jgi:hypothetical protein